VLPIKYFTNRKTKFCPLDVSAKAKLKAHYLRGWEANEPLMLSPKPLDKEQENRALNGVTISNKDKCDHCLIELYASNTFSTEAIIEWNNQTPSNQTYANAMTFFKKTRKAWIELSN
jgi:hypothetical protein